MERLQGRDTVGKFEVREAKFERSSKFEARRGAGIGIFLTGISNFIRTSIFALRACWPLAAALNWLRYGFLRQKASDARAGGASAAICRRNSRRAARRWLPLYAATGRGL